MANIGNASLDDAQQKLVEDNIRLVYDQAHKRGITDEDLIQEGMIGLCNAARFYNPEFGVKFSTYAVSYIWAALFGTYSDKKYRKNASKTCSLDDPDLNIQPQSYDAEECLIYVSRNSDPLADSIVKYVCEGFSKKEISKILSIDISQLNAILKKVGRDLYGERSNKKTLK